MQRVAAASPLSRALPATPKVIPTNQRRIVLRAGESEGRLGTAISRRSSRGLSFVGGEENRSENFSGRPRRPLAKWLAVGQIVQTFDHRISDEDQALKNVSSR